MAKGRTGRGNEVSSSKGGKGKARKLDEPAGRSSSSPPSHSAAASRLGRTRRAIPRAGLAFLERGSSEVCGRFGKFSTSCLLCQLADLEGREKDAEGREWRKEGKRTARTSKTPVDSPNSSSKNPPSSTPYSAFLALSPSSATIFAHFARYTLAESYVPTPAACVRRVTSPGARANCAMGLGTCFARGLARGWERTVEAAC
jgi:hypothetical protein